MHFRFHAPALISVTCLALASSPALAASWQANVNYGANMPMDIYVPDEPVSPAPVVVSLHYCSGTKGNAQPWLKSLADTHGFIIITPQAGGNCFDAAPARSGERANIVAMVEYALDNHDGDPNRVFATGASSGACMTHALLAAYPDVFAGGSSLAGVPAGAWTGGNEYGWSSPQQSAEAWGDIVRQGSDGFMGTWPRVQIWQAEGDTTLTYSQNYPAQVAQWTNVHGVTDADSTNEMIQPMDAQDTWNRTSYTDASGAVVVEANTVGGGVAHDLSGRDLWGDVVRFFALDMPAEAVDVGGMDGAGGTGSMVPVGGTGGATGMDPVVEDGMGGMGGTNTDSGGMQAGGQGGAASEPNSTGGMGGAGGDATGSGGVAPGVGSDTTGQTGSDVNNPQDPATPPQSGSGMPTGTTGTPTSTETGSEAAPEGVRGAGEPQPAAGSSAMPAGAAGTDMMTATDATDTSQGGSDSGCAVSNNSGNSTSAILGFIALGWLLARRRPARRCA